MPRAADQFRQSDVTLWGIIAIVTGAAALLCGSVSALIPDNVLAALHASRLSGASVNEMRTEISNVEAEQARLRAINGQLSNRVQTVEQSAGTVVRRVSALEVSVPKLVEAMATAPAIDRTLVTGSIGSSKVPRGTTQIVNDGNVRIVRSPLVPTAATAPVAPQPMPAPLAAPMPAAVLTWAAPALTAAAPAVLPDTSDISPLPIAAAAPARLGAIATNSATGVPAVADSMAMAVALGDPIEAAAAPAEWQWLSSKAKPLLVGLVPLLAKDPNGAGKVLIAGPIDGVGAAVQLCHNFTNAGIACTPVPFMGSAVSKAAAP